MASFHSGSRRLLRLELGVAVRSVRIELSQRGPRRWDAIGSELVLLVCFVLGYVFFNWDQARPAMPKATACHRLTFAALAAKNDA